METERNGGSNMSNSFNEEIDGEGGGHSEMLLDEL